MPLRPPAHLAAGAAAGQRPPAGRGRAARQPWWLVPRHQPALPLYTKVDAARRAIAHLKPVAAGRCLRVGELAVDFVPCGHLLGAVSLVLRHGDRTLVYSGDLGRDDDLLMPPPQPVPQADWLLVESTYGNRLHVREDAAARLAGIIRSTVHRGGSVLLPSFAVGRAQALLLLLQRLRAAGEIPADLPVFLDSPMATAATALYQKHRRLLRITAREAGGLLDDVTVTATPQASMALTRSRWPKVVISASGMATGGRVLHHLKVMAPNPRHHIVFPGFQVGGTRGAALVAGAGEVKIHGEYVAVKAQVSHLEGVSGHADADGLMAWLRRLPRPPARSFVVHGEAAAADTLRLRMQDELGWAVAVPAHDGEFEG
jgi:metallo-beta-lactamase family protein